MYGKETSVWRENERFRIRTVLIKILFGVGRIKRISNARIRELRVVKRERMKVFSNSMGIQEVENRFA